MDPDGLDTACQLTGATVQLAFRHLNQILIVKINTQDLALITEFSKLSSIFVN